MAVGETYLEFLKDMLVLLKGDENGNGSIATIPSIQKQIKGVKGEFDRHYKVFNNYLHTLNDYLQHDLEKEATLSKS